jgi:endonuclease/exonuclease/phosphatase (EEP) superfamily protein YafD
VTTARTLTRVLLLVLLCLLAMRVTGGESGTLWILLVGSLPLALLPAYPALVLSAFARDRLLALMALAVIGAHLAICLPRLQATTISDEARRAPTLRLATANLYIANEDPAAAGRALRRLDLDVLVVPELSDEGLAGLRASGLTEDLPHLATARGTGPETTGLLSRLPLTDVDVPLFVGRAQPEVTVTVGSTKVRVLGFHTQPALGLFVHPWRSGFGRIAERVGATDLATVVAGDLNAGLDNGPLRDLMHRADLRDAQAERGRGLATTWPAGLAFTAYDHVLVRDGARDRLEVLDAHNADIPGSDHKAVVTTIAVLGDTGR